jgi:hypothetical protein
MEILDENKEFQGRQLSINTGTIGVNIISTYEDETLDIIIKKALSIIHEIKHGNE